jgi:hypothetical protein
MGRAATWDDPRMAGLRRNAIGLMGTLAVLAPSHAAESPTQAWASSRITSCRYDVDLTALAAPYRAFGSQGRTFVCPFIAGQAPTTRAYSQMRGVRPCATSDISPLPATAATTLSLHDFGRQTGSCLAIMGRTPRRTPSGSVYVLTAPRGPPGKELSLFDALTVAARTGLPISDGHAEGDQSVQRVCLQLLPGASETPLAYLREVDATLPDGVTEARTSAANCDTVPGLNVGRAPEIPEPFKVRLRQAGTGTGAAGVGGAVRHELLSLAVAVPDTVGSFNPLEPGDTRLVVVEDLRPGSATFEVRRLTPPLCSAIYRMMTGGDAFLAPSDDESPTIVARGEASGPPRRYSTEGVAWVGSPRELCIALRPAYARATRGLEDRRHHPD